MRYISNRSSGKMGYALAEAAAARGARVILVSGPVHLPPPRGVEVVPVRTRSRDARQGLRDLAVADIVIKAAAVADFHLSKVPDQKVKKTAARISLELDPTPDILAEAGPQEGRPPADRLRRRDAEPRAGSAPQAGVEELRHGGRQFGRRQRNRASNPTRTKSFWCFERAKTSTCRAASKREIADRIFDQALKLRLALHAANGR